MKLVLIHTDIPQIIRDSFASDVIPISYNNETTKDHVTSHNDISHLAFLYHHPGYDTLPFFDTNISVDTVNIVEDDNTSLSNIDNKYTYFSNALIDIIKIFKDRNPDIIVDILTCDLNSQLFKDEVARIENDLQINIRYSVDKTGNTSVGANWILESDNVNIKDTYFTENILQWSGVLTNDISPIIQAGGVDISTYINWNAETKTYTVLKDFSWNVFVSDISDVNLTSFIALQSEEVFDGLGYSIELGTITGWQGFITSTLETYNPESTPDNRPLVKNIGILNGTTTTSGGFIVRAYQRFFRVDNCYSTGVINGTDITSWNGGGGIAGRSSGYNLGNCLLENSYSTGSIGITAGGITGTGAAIGTDLSTILFENSICTIRNCYSTGNISRRGGGISGNASGARRGLIRIENCYSTGSINSQSGGIIGQDSASNIGTCRITNCYSTGNMSENAGGIAGWYTAGINGICVIINCYSTGNIGNRSGGIGGPAIGGDGNTGGRVDISNCYTTGYIGVNAGGIVGERAGFNRLGNPFIIRNCTSRSPIAGTGSIITSNIGNNILPATNNITDISVNNIGLDNFEPSMVKIVKNNILNALIADRTEPINISAGALKLEKEYLPASTLLKVKKAPELDIATGRATIDLSQQLNTSTPFHIHNPSVGGKYTINLSPILSIVVDISGTENDKEYMIENVDGTFRDGEEYTIDTYKVLFGSFTILKTKTVISNLLIIHEKVPDKDAFINSLNSDTVHVILNNRDTPDNFMNSFNGIIDGIKENDTKNNIDISFSTITNIALVFDNVANRTPFFEYSAQDFTNETIHKSTYMTNFNNNVNKKINSLRLRIDTSNNALIQALIDLSNNLVSLQTLPAIPTLPTSLPSFDLSGVDYTNPNMLTPEGNEILSQEEEALNIRYSQNIIDISNAFHEYDAALQIYDISVNIILRQFPERMDEINQMISEIQDISENIVIPGPYMEYTPTFYSTGKFFSDDIESVLNTFTNLTTIDILSCTVHSNTQFTDMSNVLIRYSTNVTGKSGDWILEAKNTSDSTVDEFTKTIYFMPENTEDPTLSPSIYSYEYNLGGTPPVPDGNGNYLITNQDELYWLMTNQDTSGVEPNLTSSYILTTNVDMTSYISLSESIGKSTAIPFTGNFDGSNNTITIGSVDTSFNGLFGFIDGTAEEVIIKDLNVIYASDLSMNITGIDVYIGSFVGLANIDCSIINCHVDISGNANFTVDGTGTIGLGGFGGRIFLRSDISNCSLTIDSSATLIGISDNSFIGGFIGFIDASCNILNSILDISNNLFFDASGGNSRLGGFCGISTINSNIISSSVDISGIAFFNTKGVSSYSGGFCGSNGSNSSIDGCNVTINSDMSCNAISTSFIGGFCGMNLTTNSNIKNSSVTISGEFIVNCGVSNNVGGFVGHNISDVIIQDCSSIISNGFNCTGTGDFGNVGGFCGFNSTNSNIIRCISIISNDLSIVNNNFAPIMGGFCGHNINNSNILDSSSTIIGNCNISGLSFNSRIGGFCGLNSLNFGDISNCNLDISGNINFNGGNVSLIGGFCGYNFNKGIIKTSRINISGDSNISGNDSSRIGGFCGYIEMESFITDSIVNIDSSANFSLTNNFGRMGGFCGNNLNQSIITNSICNISGNANFTGTGGSIHIGGFCGFNEVSGSIISNSTASINTLLSNCSGNNNITGGFCGKNFDNCTITDSSCIIINDLLLNGSGGFVFSGGFCGQNIASCDILNSYLHIINDITISGQDGNARMSCFCGENNSNCDISNCIVVVDGTIDISGGTTSVSSDQLGGFCGLNISNSNIISSSLTANNTVTIRTNTSICRTGGFCGVNRSNITLCNSILNSSFTININNPTGNSCITGGFCGFNFISTISLSGLYIASQFIINNIVSNRGYIGGFCGLNENNSAINDSSANILDNIIITTVGNDHYMGGFCGWNVATSTILNSKAVISNIAYDCSGNFNFLGGFCGRNLSLSQINNSSVDISSNLNINCSGGVNFLGGFNGFNQTLSDVSGGSYVNINGNIDVSNNGNTLYLGGFSGYNLSSCNNNICNANINNINLNGSGDLYFIGGFCGRNRTTSIISSSSTSINNYIINIDGNNNINGGIVGLIDNGSSVNDCNCTINSNYTVNIIGLKIGIFVGGIIGDNFLNSNISDCSGIIHNFNAISNISNSYIGGYIGAQDTSSNILNGNVTINDSINVISNGNENYVGGFCGYNVNNSTIYNSNSTITSDILFRDISGDSVFMGGFCGRNGITTDICDISNSTITISGNVLFDASGTNINIGGFCGSNNINSIISNNCSLLFSGDTVMEIHPTNPDISGSYIGAFTALDNNTTNSYTACTANLRKTTYINKDNRPFIASPIGNQQLTIAPAIPLVKYFDTEFVFYNDTSNSIIHNGTTYPVVSQFTYLNLLIDVFDLTVIIDLGAFPLIPSISIIPPCCIVNVPNMNPQNTNKDSSVINSKESGRIISTDVNSLYNTISQEPKRIRVQPIFSSYRDYMLYLQSKHR